MTHTYNISKKEVYEAYLKVKANKGAAGIDGQSIDDFVLDLENNLYKIWNRMNSGSYMPPAVKQAEIPKSDGKTRVLGIPTVSDRIAQTVAKSRLEPNLEQNFHGNSYGYRPGRSALEAIKVANARCRQLHWVIDMDIKGFFDNIDHDLMMKALDKHTEDSWIKLYTKRWLKAPVVGKEGGRAPRNIGTPQGGVISPLLANLYLHYTFDKWMEKNNPDIKFERYADDVIVHCRSEQQAEAILDTIKDRMEECKLTLHPIKTKIVCIKKNGQVSNKGKYPRKFTFLGYEFKPRRMKYQGKFYVTVRPAISNKAKKTIRANIREWNMPHMTAKNLEQIAKQFNARIRGWFQYYGALNEWDMQTINYYLDSQIVRWLQHKYKHLRNKTRDSWKKLYRMKKENPKMWVHWLKKGDKTGRAV